MATPENRLIALLPRPDRVCLLAACEPFALTLSDALCEPGEPVRHVYFPTDGVIALLARVPGAPGVEVGMVGREGMLGAELALGQLRAPLHALVQGTGMAWRVSTRAFRAALRRSPALQRVLHCYLSVLMAQLASSAACLRFHLIGPRLARWLLMSQDRTHADHFHVTHVFLAAMLGVRRVGVTAAATKLQCAGLIRYRRGEIAVLDRPGLEAAACTCYGAQRVFYATALGETA